MALKCGIVGLPNVGKSTLFNALTCAKALVANYPFATKDAQIGMIIVPDPRLDKLKELVNPKNVVPTTVEIVDIAGLIKGASKNEGLGNQFLADIREVHAIVYVVRCFDDDNIIHVENSVDPVRDKSIIDNELLLKDLLTIEKRLDRYKKNTKGGDKTAVRALETAERIYKHVENGQPARTMQLTDEETLVLNEMYLLTAKPILYICNVDEASVLTGNNHTKRFIEAIKGEKAEVILISAAIEAEIAELDSLEERLEFIESMGLDEPGVNKVIRGCYKLLNYITYFTAGEKEVRAWQIHRGWTAPQSAGVIHSDFERGFIRARVIKYADFVQYGSEKAVQEVGKVRVEGKEYVTEDGDVMHFLFNV